MKENYTFFQDKVPRKLYFSKADQKKISMKCFINSLLSCIFVVIDTYLFEAGSPVAKLASNPLDS